MIDIYDYDLLPPHMLESMRRYAEDRVPVGDFLQAIIDNDLKEAVGRADSTNIELLPVYVCWFYNEAPGACWGSRARYASWLAMREET